jgi:TPR repeat protein
MFTRNSRFVAITIFGLAALLPGTYISALEGAGVSGSAADKAPLFKTPRAALQAGLEEFRSGDASSALAALTYAASGGEPLAQWKLAKIYANGEGVARDDLKAYEYFSQIVAEFDEDSPNRREQVAVSNAIVAVGVYNLTGIANTRVRPDPARAMQMFQYAATRFGDPSAQYNLARMHLDGVGVAKDSRQGLRWLYLAAQKSHLQAQALLGQILLTGEDGAPAQPARALMWLTLAREAASDAKKDQWIIDLYDRAMAAANKEDRQIALVYLEDHLKGRN